MKIIKIFISMALMIGFPCPIISASLDMQHFAWFTPICFLSSFIGVGLIFGFSEFLDKPRWIGNVDKVTHPKINQAWAVFFISLIINLTLANLCG